MFREKALFGFAQNVEFFFIVSGSEKPMPLVTALFILATIVRDITIADNPAQFEHLSMYKTHARHAKTCQKKIVC